MVALSRGKWSLVMGIDVPTLRYHMGRLYPLHRGATFHLNHYTRAKNHWVGRLDRGIPLIGRDRAPRPGVWSSETYFPSQTLIFRTSERSYTMNITLIYSSEHCRKSKRICLNCSGSRDHRVTTPIKNRMADRTTHLLFKTSKIIQIGSRSSENGVSNIDRCAVGGPP